MPSFSPLRVWYIFFGGVALAGIILSSIWLFINWQSQEYQIVNFAAAWYPFAASIFLFFVPDLEKKMKRAALPVRLVIVLLAALYSGVLWHQQTLAAQQSHNDQEALLMNAVMRSNEHSDQQISGVAKDLEHSTERLDSRLDSLSQLVAKSETDLTSSISKVGVPIPTYARLQFSFSAQSQSPLLVQAVQPDKDGVFSVDVFATNISETVAAKVGDIWVIICDVCSFADEPQGFDRPAGTVETARHMMFGQLNPGVTLAKFTIRVKAPSGAPSFVIGCKYSCETCGKMEANPQILQITKVSN